MYNEKILKQLDNLKYLGALKGSNISVISKPNEFGDAVKFYAQINKEDIIQKITYRASGCTHFLVFCNYFCSLVEGKTIKSALNVKAEKLENFVELDEGKKHIISIILDAFALLIKRYRKGVEKGKIEPCDVAEKTAETPKSRPMTSKAFTKVVGEIIKNIELSHKDDTKVVNNERSNDTLTKLMDIKNKKHKEIEDKKTTEEVKPVVDTKEKPVKKTEKTEDEPVVDTKVVEAVKFEEVAEKKTAKRGRKPKEETSVQTQELDKDELLENLIDEGIFLDDYLANASKKVEQPVEEKSINSEVVEKPKKATKKTAKKVKEEPVIEEEKSIEELNKEITGLIDIMEADEEPSVVDIQSVEKTEEQKVVEPKKEKKVAKKETKPETKKTATKVEKTPKKAEVKEEKKEPVEVKSNAQEKQSSNLLALKSMLSNRNATKVETKTVEEKKPETKVNNLTAMISKMNSNKSSDNKTIKTEVKKEKPVEKNNKEDRLSSLKLSLANMQIKNETNTKSATEKTAKNTKKAETKKPTKAEKQEKVKKEKAKEEKTKPAKKEIAKKENKKVEKKPVEKKEKQPKEVASKKAKKNSYDMEYETIDYSEKKGFFSWLKRK